MEWLRVRIDTRKGGPKPPRSRPRADGGVLRGEVILGANLKAAVGRVRIFGEFLQERKEGRRLADEQAHVRQKLDHTFGNVFCLRRANNRTRR